MTNVSDLKDPLPRLYHGINDVRLLFDADILVKRVQLFVSLFTFVVLLGMSQPAA